MPRRAFEALLRAAGVLSDLDTAARAGYEQRASGAGAPPRASSHRGNGECG